MHEAAIAEQLIAAARAQLTRSGAHGRVLRLEVTVGRLSGVSSEALRFAFEQLAPGSPVAGAALAIAEPQAQCHCGVCGKQTLSDDLFGGCPACGSADVTIEGGRELLLQAIEVED
jgi:hydrogenase nickel incorporation protein HypA/HybF